MNIFQTIKARNKLIRAFKEGGIYKSIGNDERKIYPKIHQIPDDKYDYYVFTLPNGVDPKILKKKFYVFQQFFGKNIILDGEFKQFKLSVKNTTLIDKVNYDYQQIHQIIQREKIIIPIVCGMSEKGDLKIYDATNSPNLLIYGEPGSGKSSILHAILTTLIQCYKPNQIEFYLADFKMSELNLYEGVEHVKSVSYLDKEFGQALSHLRKELTIRGKLLKYYRVRHINKLQNDHKPPYIILCVDEFVMIRDENIMAELLQIASLGRAYGIYLILSVQRPSHKIISTDVRGLLSVRMGFRTVDRRNAMIGETPGSETIPKKGYEGTFFLKMDELEQLRSPYLDEDQTENLISKFKKDDWKNHNYKINSPVDRPGESKQKVLTEKDVFYDVDY
ncbi:FtsK/SpoIIIE domain-containing protein [Heyndrickxia oleronia]|uniref:FtsK/SpoIIIE domain-containing protein n=1 Tax=Heyndrickxia oleronia TaxID=38875 RepID=UPI00203F68C2|nr:FtsK/SpoIIIE domain-containing protein [Heyndrickxia oleronia]